MPVQTSHQLDRHLQHNASLRYLLALPEGYGESDAKWPLLLFLHGAGERGDSLDLVKVHGPPKQVENGQRLPFVVVSPQAPADSWWDVEALAALLDEVMAEHRIDPDRVYVTGLSMGGFGTWELVSTYPERFAAAIPICGGGTPRKICNARDVPIWAFHGDADTSVPLTRSEEMVMWLQERCDGDKVRLTVYPGVGHDSWTRTYDNPEVYEWLLSHRRGE